MREDYPGISDVTIHGDTRDMVPINIIGATDLDSFRRVTGWRVTVEDGDLVPFKTPMLSADCIKESLVNLSQQERQELYRVLYNSFGCRMY